MSLSVYPYYFFFLISRLFTFIVIFFKYGSNFFIIFIFILIILIFIWFKDVCFEGLRGYHNFFVQDGLKYGMMLFIFREFIFFFCIFWLFFDTSIVLMIDVGDTWPIDGLVLINPLGVPLLNSFVLLRSAASVTWSHYSLLSNNNSLTRLFLTILLSVYFLLLQRIEYLESFFSIRRGIYGRIFFFSTGFHGLHVLFGSIFLIVNYTRILNNHFRYTHHLGFEFSIIYWHFVDVVWLFLFVFVYWWSF